MANTISFGDSKFKIGDLLRVQQTYHEGDKEKTQTFEGRLIAISGQSPNTTIKLRKIGADNIGIEKTIPLLSPTITKIVLKKSFPASRAKLYYLRRQ